MVNLKYTWDEDKAVKVSDEHKIEFARILDVFDDPYTVDFIDEKHSTEGEIRYVIIGLTAAYGLVFLSYTEPTETELHFITARHAEKWMVDDYEENRKRF